MCEIGNEFHENGRGGAGRGPPVCMHVYKIPQECSHIGGGVFEEALEEAPVCRPEVVSQNS